MCLALSVALTFALSVYSFIYEVFIWLFSFSWMFLFIGRNYCTGFFLFRAAICHWPNIESICHRQGSYCYFSTFWRNFPPPEKKINAHTHRTSDPIPPLCQIVQTNWELFICLVYLICGVNKFLKAFNLKLSRWIIFEGEHFIQY